MADATVHIKVDIDDKYASKKLTRIAEQVQYINAHSRSMYDMREKFQKILDKETRSFSQLDKQYTKHWEKLREARKIGDLWKGLFGTLAKFAKFGAIEFGGMTVVLGGLKLALVAGRAVMKAFHASLIGLGAAAGIAMAGLGAVLAAMRELQVAQMKPLFKSVYATKDAPFPYSDQSYRSPAAMMRAQAKDKRFAMFSDQAMTGMMNARLKAGRSVGSDYRNELARLADFTGGDEKALTSLNQAMIGAAKSGKITGETYQELLKTAPGLAKAFEEMAGGEKNAQKAADAGKISYQAFNDAIMKGDLEALKPYKGSLDEINNTVMGKFKGAIRTIKEEFVSVGTGPILDAVRAPMDSIVNSVQGSIIGVSGILQTKVPGMLGGADTAVSKALDRVVFYIGRGMDWLHGFSGTLNTWIGNVRNFFTEAGAWIERVTAPWDSLYQNILKPLGELLGSTIKQYVESFGKSLANNGKYIETWGKAIGRLKDTVGVILGALSAIKSFIAPLIALFEPILGFTNMILKLGGGILGKFVIGLGIMYLAMRKVIKGFIEWKSKLIDIIRETAETRNEVVQQDAVVTKLTEAMDRLKAEIAGVVAGLREQAGAHGAVSNAMQQQLNAQKALMPGPAQKALMPGRGYVPMPGQPGGAVSRPSRFQPFFPDYAPYAPPPPTRWQRWRGAAGNAARATRARIANLPAMAYAGLSGTVSGARVRISGRYNSFLQNRQEYRDLRAQAKAELQAGQQLSNETANSMAEFEKMQGKRVAAANAKWGSIGAMGGMMAGGMINDSSIGRTTAGNMLGSGLSAMGTGAMLGSMTNKKFGNTNISMGAIGAAGGLVAGAAGAWKNHVAATNRGGQATLGAVQGAAMGASMGAIAGPWGAAAGAVAGGLYGGITSWVQSSKAKKQAYEAAEKAAHDTVMGNGRMTSKKDFKTAAVNLAGARMRLNAAQAERRRQNDTMARLTEKNKGYNIDMWSKADQDAYNKAKKRYDNLGELVKYADRQRTGFDKAERELKRAGNVLNANFGQGKVFGFDPKQISDYAKRHHIDLGKEALGIKAMMDMAGWSQKAADKVGNFAVAAKRVYEALTSPLQAKKDAAQAGIEMQQALADYLAGLNQPQSEDERLLAATNAIESIVKLNTSSLGAGIYGYGPKSVTKMTESMNKRLEMLLQASAVRPGATPENQATLRDMVAQTQWRTAEQMNSFGGRFELDPGFANDVNNVTNGFAKQIGSEMDAFTKGGKRTTKELSDKQTELVKKYSMAEAQLLTKKYGLTDDVTKTATALQKTMIGTLKDNGVEVYTGTFRALMTGGQAAAAQIAAMFNSTRLVKDGDGWKWVSGASKSAGKGTTGPSFSAYGAQAEIQNMAKFGYQLDESQYLFIGDAQHPDLTPVKASWAPFDTPTSRFSRTMTSHSLFNGMVPGNRSVISGLRNFNLGSPSSDHLKGAAYDLTGDNLGAYSRLVNASGGFAEFHGAMGSRHLHVVPPHGGDTATSRMVGSMAGGAVYNYTINVSGGPNASPAAIADEVIMRIRRAERDSMERA